MLHSANCSTLTFKLNTAAGLFRELHISLVSAADLPISSKPSAHATCVRCLAESAALLGVLPLPSMAVTRQGRSIPVQLQLEPVRRRHPWLYST